MSYLLDTNACIALINGKPASVRTRFQEALNAGADLLVPVVAVFELCYGAAKSSRPETTFKRVDAFLAGPVSILPFDHTDAAAAGQLRAELEAVGKPIGAYDVLIAGQALRQKLVLVTANAREFGRVKGLAIVDWASA